MTGGDVPSLGAGGLITLGITAVALLLFLSNRLRVDVVALIVMLLLMATRVLTPQEALQGFAHEATITVALVLVLAAGLLRTGAVNVLARWIARVAGRSELRLIAVTILIVVPLSAVINNTAAVAVMLPMLLGLARSAELAPSRLLMPMAFSSQLGGTLTLIGTSTNLLVAGVALDLGVERIRLFDITAPAAIIGGFGLLYLLTIGRWLLPHREATADLMATYRLHDYLTALRVTADSRLAGRSLAETRFGDAHGLQIIRVQHGDGVTEAPSGATVLRAGDVLMVEGKIPDIARIGNEGGLTLADVDLPLGEQRAEGEVRLAEVIVPPRSQAQGRSVRELALRARYGISVLAVRRHGERVRQPVGDVRLRAGDMLLVQGQPETFTRLHEGSALVLLGAVSLPEVRVRRMKFAIPIVAGVLVLPALGLMPIVMSALIGVIAMFLTRCIRPDEAYAEMDWMVIVLLGAILPLGEAMHRTGAAGFVAHHLLELARPLGVYGVLAAFLLITTALTSVISNAAAAVVLAPVAVASAATLGLSPLPFVMAVMIGASNSFISPVGYQTSTMIYGPGGYRFSDYLRVGAPLSLIVIAAATFAIPRFFPF